MGVAGAEQEYLDVPFGCEALGWLPNGDGTRGTANGTVNGTAWAWRTMEDHLVSLIRGEGNARRLCRVSSTVHS